MFDKHYFHWADYVVTVAMLLVSLGIGVFFALFKGGQKTKVEYLLGNREMSLVPVCMSMFVTFISAVSLIGTPSDTFNTGPMIMYLYYGIALGYLIGYFTVVPLMYPLHLTSVYEYLGLRFKSQKVRLVGTAIGMFQTTLYMGVALFSPALALQAAAGIPLWMSVAIVGSIGTIYTAVGGIKSVVWTDVFQSVILFIGIIVILIKGIQTVGSFSTVIDIAEKGGRMDFANFDFDPRVRHSMWACIFGGALTWMVNLFNQSAIQRIGALKTLTSAKRVYLLNLPLNMAFGSLLTITGILLYAYVVTTGCDPYAAGIISNTNQMMPYFVLDVLNQMPGMAGLYMATLFSGALSTVSSGINALAANTVEDVLATPLRRFSDKTVTVIAKLMVVVYGMITVGLAYLMQSVPGPVTQIATSAFGACGGPVVGMFLLGAAFPRGNKYGAIGGGVLSLIINLWLAVGTKIHGSPITSLPPGPVYNCFPGNETQHVNFNITSSVYDVTTFSVGDSVTPSMNVSDDVMFVVNVTASVVDGVSNSPSMGSKAFSLYDVSYLYYGPIGLIICVSTGIIISLITGGEDPTTVDSRLIFYFLRKLYKLPEPVHYPADTSNVIAMKNYRQAQKAFEEFRKTSIDQDVRTDIKDNPNDAKVQSADIATTFLRDRECDALLRNGETTTTTTLRNEETDTFLRNGDHVASP